MATAVVTPHATAIAAIMVIMVIVITVIDPNPGSIATLIRRFFSPSFPAANHEHLPETWADLTGELPLRPVHDDIEYNNAVEMLDRIAVLDVRTADQEDYLETLSNLVERYDDEHFAKKDSEFLPIDSLRYLCEHNGMSASDLGELLGNRSLGSKILREERQLSKEHIRKLCDRFSVSSDLFL